MGEEIEKTLKRRARNPVTGKNEVIGNMSYEKWYDSKVKTYGQAEIDKAYKITKNKAIDKEQYERYVSRLGRKNIGTLENFVKIKYNDTGVWNDTKYNYKLVDTHSFDGCDSLISITLPDNLKEIGAYAFDGCQGLKEVTIPNSVHSIGYHAFRNYPNLILNVQKNSSAHRFAYDNGISFKII